MMCMDGHGAQLQRARPSRSADAVLTIDLELEDPSLPALWRARGAARGGGARARQRTFSYACVDVDVDNTSASPVLFPRARDRVRAREVSVKNG